MGLPKMESGRCFGMNEEETEGPGTANELIQCGAVPGWAMSIRRALPGLAFMELGHRGV